MPNMVSTIFADFRVPAFPNKADIMEKIVRCQQTQKHDFLEAESIQQSYPAGQLNH